MFKSFLRKKEICIIVNPQFFLGGGVWRTDKQTSKHKQWCNNNNYDTQSEKIREATIIHIVRQGCIMYVYNIYTISKSPPPIKKIWKYIKKIVIKITINYNPWIKEKNCNNIYPFSQDSSDIFEVWRRFKENQPTMQEVTVSCLLTVCFRKINNKVEETRFCVGRKGEHRIFSRGWGEG